METKKLRCILYVRRSKEDKNKKYSIDNQIQKLKILVAYNNHEIVKTIVDDGKTGRNFNRSGIKEVFDLAMNQKIDYVYVLRIDRFGRSLTEGTFYAIGLFMLGIGIITEDQEFNFNELKDMLMFVIDQYSSQKESDDIGKRTKSTKEMRFKEKIWVHSHLPFGYTKDEEDKWICKRIDAAKLIKDIFKDYLKYKNYKDTIENNDRPFKEIFNIYLTRDRLKRILRNPLYKGIATFGDLNLKDPDLVIVPAENFDQVQNLLPKNTVKKKSNHINEFFNYLIKKFNLTEIQLADYVTRIHDLKPDCKKGHGQMVSNGHTTVKGYRMPNCKCSSSDCNYERALIRAFEMYEYDVPILLSCPVCRKLEYFNVENGLNDTNTYTCKNCYASFTCSIHPDKYKRRRNLKKKKRMNSSKNNTNQTTLT